MANFPSLLPRGSGGNRRGFQQLVSDISNYYGKAYRDAYYQEASVLLTAIINTTPIDTGYAAGVIANKVGIQKRAPYAGHKASGLVMGNDPGNSGWQMLIDSDKDKQMKISIVSPMWDSYLKFLEYGDTTPLPKAKPRFVFTAWKKFEKRKDAIRKKVASGRGK